MGVFDTVRCEFRLPNPLHQDLEFQTKDLDGSLNRYTITRDGRLIRHPRREDTGPGRDAEWPIHGDVRICGGGAEDEERFVEYVVRFTHGRVEWVRPAAEQGRPMPGPSSVHALASMLGGRSVPLDAPRHETLHEIVKRLPSDFEPWGQRSRESAWGPDCSCGCRWFIPLEEDLRFDWGICSNARSPRCGLLTFEHQGCPEFDVDEVEDGAAPPEDLGAGPGGSERDAERALLRNLRLHQPELETLFRETTDHWGFEDPVYRFYHRSFKVYGLQKTTKAIVRLLTSLAPDRPLNPWFVEIVEAGTGKRFAPEDNARWTRVTRPVLEAFFHARFFLEMAVRYANLDRLPAPLPSGYAALLYLYDLRCMPPESSPVVR